MSTLAGFKEALNESIEGTETTVLNLKKDDVLFVSIQAYEGYEERAMALAKYIKATLEEAGYDNKCIFYTGTVEFKILRKEDA